MLPALPRTFGKLSDVFVSALGSVTGVENRLGLKRVSRTTAFLIDGLGSHNLRTAAGHAPYLNSVLKDSGSIGVGFPATTATSIASFSTGLPAGKHGLVGYSVYDKSLARTVNLLSGWGNDQVPELWQPYETVAERALAANVKAYVVGPAEYAGSGFTRATMRGAEYVPARTIEDRFTAVAKLHAAGGNFICYAYIPELDQIAHSRGWQSARWLEVLEEIDGQAKALQAKLGKTDGLLITADHGVIDVPSDKHIYLDSLEISWPEHIQIAGDPRVSFIYCQDTDVDSLVGQLRLHLEDLVSVLTRGQVIEAGWYGAEIDATVLGRLPQIFLVPKKPVALYHRDFASPQSLKMIGQHGSVSNDEMQVPLLKLAGYR